MRLLADALHARRTQRAQAMTGRRADTKPFALPPAVDWAHKGIRTMRSMRGSSIST